MGVDVKLVTVGKKGEKYFKRRADRFNIIGEFLMQWQHQAMRLEGIDSFLGSILYPTSAVRIMDYFCCAANYGLGATPTTKEAQAIADELYADFVSEEVDKVEMIYTKFVSLISSDPVVQTLLPLTPQVRDHHTSVLILKFFFPLITQIQSTPTTPIMLSMPWRGFYPMACGISM